MPLFFLAHCLSLSLFVIQADSVGARFVNVSFTPETEAQAREMMRLVQLAFLRRLPALKWMSSADKMKAADKLTGMVRRGSRGHAMLLRPGLGRRVSVGGWRSSRIFMTGLLIQLVCFIFSLIVVTKTSRGSSDRHEPPVPASQLQVRMTLAIGAAVAASSSSASRRLWPCSNHVKGLTLPSDCYGYLSCCSGLPLSSTAHFENVVVLRRFNFKYERYMPVDLWSRRRRLFTVIPPAPRLVCFHSQRSDRLPPLQRFVLLVDFKGHEEPTLQARRSHTMSVHTGAEISHASACERQFGVGERCQANSSQWYRFNLNCSVSLSLQFKCLRVKSTPTTSVRQPFARAAALSVRRENTIRSLCRAAELKCHELTLNCAVLVGLPLHVLAVAARRIRRSTGTVVLQLQPVLTWRNPSSRPGAHGHGVEPAWVE